jgi:hypothetical protein
MSLTDASSVTSSATEPLVPLPGRRHLRVFGFDPMTSRLSAAHSASQFLTISVPMETLARGPAGRLIRVVDFHPPTGAWFWPVDLDDARLAHTDGLRPSEADPRSHQQMVYAVAMSVIERFERFLGRQFRWRSEEWLALVPHAFEGRNAFFDPARKAVLFGYFTASRNDPGANLPGQRIFTCLSMDIIAHEVTHALVHRLRPYYIRPTNPDVLAWHEAFADLVALFHHFAFEDVVREAVASSRGDLSKAAGLFDLAAEFGASTGRGMALRSAIKQVQDTAQEAEDAAESGAKPPKPFNEVTEPHERGAVFVSAVFEAFVTSYSRSIEDLVRIATGGSGVLPPGHLPPDLVGRVTAEAVVIADRYLGMVVRAFDYMPVLDVTFGDVLRSIVTADRDLYPDDGAGLRGTLVESFRRRGIFPDDVASLADDSMAWPPAPSDFRVSDEVRDNLGLLVALHAMELRPAGERGLTGVSSSGDGGGPLSDALDEWVEQPGVAEILGFDPEVKIELEGQHASFRQAENRQPQPEIVLQFLQRRKDLEPDVPGTDDNNPLRAGTTVVVTMTGDVRYVIAKPLPAMSPPTEAYQQRVHDVGKARLKRLADSARQALHDDVTSMWFSSASGTTFQRLHFQVDGSAS